ncbi:DUF4767 domain-containing protein [Streptococcus downei]|uniref:DUF4767 domain-containing protein n=1 Tax=Streptococcus downei MFe28 TaxID=764290 RepID=A0A380JCW0_STRDO|nr:hypothetical protein [Streptococcus downei]SUN35851.1 Uncharacterised protein [Streptococcus downei MFe28]
MKKLSPKELEWVRLFEEINHRPPTTKEMRVAFAKRRKALRKKRGGLSNLSKILITAVIFFLMVALTVLIFQLRESKKELAQSRKVVETKKKQASSSTTSSSSSSSISKKDWEKSSGSSEVYNQERKSKYWNSNKATSLANYMAAWGEKMSQPDYKEISIDLPVYWKGGSELSRDEIIVAGYEYWYGDDNVHRYIFVINSSGQGKVLYSHDSSGSKYTVTETDNRALKEEFDKIVSGEPYPNY